MSTETMNETENPPAAQPTLHASHGNPNPPAPAPPKERKKRADAGKPNPLRANRGASKFSLEANLFTPIGRETLKFWIMNGFGNEALEVVDRLLIVTQETKALLDDLLEKTKK